MQNKPIRNSFILFSLLLVACGLISQSCNKVDTIQPVNTMPYRVTVKITDLNSGSTEGSSQTPLSFRIISTSMPETVILDTTIAGNCAYSFNCTAGTTIKAALYSVSNFNSTIEIDINGRKDAYHSGSCVGTEYDLTDYIGE